MPIALFAIAGGIIGGTIASTLGFTFAIGWAIGSLIGQLLAPKPTQYISGPRLENTSPAVSNIIGSPIQIPFGLIRIPGSIIWSNSITEREIVNVQKTKGGSLGGSKKTVTRTYEYYLDFAVALCEGPILGIRKIWANNKIIFDQDGDVVAEPWLNYRLYLGDETQEPDPLMVEILGSNNVPAHRGLAYIVFEQFKLEEYGNRAPYSIEFEVATSDGYEKVPAVDFIYQSTGGNVLFDDQIRYEYPNGDILAGLTGDEENWAVYFSKNAPQAPRFLPIPQGILLAAQRESGNISNIGKSTFLGRNAQGYFVAVFPIDVIGGSELQYHYAGFFDGSFRLAYLYGPMRGTFGASRVIFDKYIMAQHPLLTTGLTPSLDFYYIDVYGGTTVDGGGGNTKTWRFRSTPPLNSVDTIGVLANFGFSSTKLNVAKSWQNVGPNVVQTSYSSVIQYATLVSTNDSKIGNPTTPPNTDVMVYRYSESDFIGSWTGEMTYFKLHPWVRLNNANISESNPIVTVPAEFKNYRSVISSYIIDGNIWIFGIIKITSSSDSIVCYKVESGSTPHADGYYEPTNIYVNPNYFIGGEFSVLANSTSTKDSGVQYGKGHLDFTTKVWTAITDNYIIKFNFRDASWQNIDKEYYFGLNGGFEVPLQGNNYLWHGIHYQPRAETLFLREKIIEDSQSPLTVDQIVSKICDKAGLISGQDWEFITCCSEETPVNPSY